MAGEAEDLSVKDRMQRKHKDGEDFVTNDISLGQGVAFRAGVAYSHPSNGQRRLYYE